MDIHPLLRWLQAAAVPDRGNTVPRRIIRFRRRDLFRRFVHEWSKLAPSRRPTAVRRMPLIHAISCAVHDIELPPELARYMTIEDDSRIAVHSTARKGAPSNGIPWGVRQVKAPSAWNRTTGHRVKIGVIDTGVEFTHPDLRNSLDRGINLVVRGMPPHDDNGHGTHIAGTIAAANRMRGMIGVAPRAMIHPVKAFDRHGTAYVSDIILGIDWCVRNRMDVINMSFGMKNRSKSLLTAVVNAYNAGVIIVASSGNDGKRKSVDYPARFPQTVSVGASTRLHRIAPFSNRGTAIDIYAPGDKIKSAWLGGTYHEMSGTSMATSHVSGAIALLLAYRPGLSPPEIKAILKRSVQPLRGTKAPRRTGVLDISRMMKAADKL